MEGRKNNLCVVKTIKNFFVILQNNRLWFCGSISKKQSKTEAFLSAERKSERVGKVV
ncbi:MAG: hypothetical protein ACLUR9_05010 [Christensenellales bacterium]